MTVSLESLELLLAEAAQCLDDAARELRQLPQIDLTRNLHRIGTALGAVWDFRDELHKARPDLRPNFVVEHAADRERYSQLSKRSKEAYGLEDSGDQARAVEAFIALRSAAKRGYFCMVAEAGLFWLSEQGGASFNRALERTREG
jgi:hypothetical protein